MRDDPQVMQLRRELSIQKRLTQAAIDTQAHWDDVSEFLVWGRADDEHEKPVTPEHAQTALARFPQYAKEIERFVKEWNKAPQITDEVLAALDTPSADRVDDFTRRAQSMLKYYTKLRCAEEALAAAQDKIIEAKATIDRYDGALRFYGEGSHYTLKTGEFSRLENAEQYLISPDGNVGIEDGTCARHVLSGGAVVFSEEPE